MSSSEQDPDRATELLLVAKRNLGWQIWWLALRLKLRGYRLNDVYGAMPGLMDVWGVDRYFYDEEYTYVGQEPSDFPESRRRTLGYHWQLIEDRRLYREQIQMTVNEAGEPKIVVLYANFAVPADRQGWRRLVLYLKAKGYFGRRTAR
jgi:hypothetical protein